MPDTSKNLRKILIDLLWLMVDAKAKRLEISHLFLNTEDGKKYSVIKDNLSEAISIAENLDMKIENTNDFLLIHNLDSKSYTKILKDHHLGSVV